MAKQSITQRSSIKPKAHKSGKSKNHILKDHDLNTLIVIGKRKRVPTERALEALSLLKPSKKIKKVATKPKVKRLNTMQKTAREGKAYLKSKTQTKKHSASKSPEKDQSPEKESPKETTKVKKQVDRSRSRNTLKSNKGSKGSSKSRSTSNKNRSQSKGSKGSKGFKSKEIKGNLKRTKTIEQTIADAKKFLGPAHGHDHDEHSHASGSEDEAPAKHAIAKTAKKGGNIKRTHTMNQTIAEAKNYLVKGPRSTSKGKGKK